MTLFKPTLILKRLAIYSGSYVAYDENFHSGVNVIRGANSSGKSTILNFIFFALGGSLVHWSEAALRCSHCVAEVEVNGKAVTLRRYVDEGSNAPVDMFGGSFADAMSAPPDDWKRYPYRRSQGKESFSQVMFRLLEMPDVALESTGSVTMHQVLRLLYADQLSPVDDLFYQDGIDFPQNREAVGNLICGAFDEKIYDLQLTLKRKEKEYQLASAELRSIILLLGGAGQSFSLETVMAQATALEEKRDKISAEINVAEEALYNSENEDKITLSAYQKEFKIVTGLQSELKNVDDSISSVELDYADSQQYINFLKDKISALQQSGEVAKYITEVKFGSCPACHAEIHENDGIACCSLCKAPFDKERAQERIVGIINETAIQLRQSEILQSKRLTKIEELKESRDILRNKWRTSSKRLQSLQVLPSSEKRDHLRELHKKIGYVDHQIDDVANKRKLAEKVTSLTEAKERLRGEVESLTTSIEKIKAEQAARLQKSYKDVADEVIDLLKKDLLREDAFENPQSVYFSFAKNELTVDGKQYFSASSRVILKSSFLVGMMAAALKKSYFRHLRFLLIDITEDKGMEVVRTYNFQNQVVNISNESEVDHQFILATSMPSPELNEELFVGKYSSRDEQSLRLI